MYHNIPLPADIADLQEEVDDIINHDLELNYGQLDDSELDRLMEPQYDEHDGK